MTILELIIFPFMLLASIMVIGTTTAILTVYVLIRIIAEEIIRVFRRK